jgi:hypothetical protein
MCPFNTQLNYPINALILSYAIMSTSDAPYSVTGTGVPIYEEAQACILAGRDIPAQWLGYISPVQIMLHPTIRQIHVISSCGDAIEPIERGTDLLSVAARALVTRTATRR